MAKKSSSSDETVSTGKKYLLVTVPMNDSATYTIPYVMYGPIVLKYFFSEKKLFDAYAELVLRHSGHTIKSFKDVLKLEPSWSTGYVFKPVQFGSCVGHAETSVAYIPVISDDNLPDIYEQCKACYTDRSPGGKDAWIEKFNAITR